MAELPQSVVSAHDESETSSVYPGFSMAFHDALDLFDGRREPIEEHAQLEIRVVGGEPALVEYDRGEWWDVESQVVEYDEHVLFGEEAQTVHVVVKTGYR